MGATKTVTFLTMVLALGGCSLEAQLESQRFEASEATEYVDVGIQLEDGSLDLLGGPTTQNYISFSLACETEGSSQTYFPTNGVIKLKKPFVCKTLAINTTGYGGPFIFSAENGLFAAAIKGSAYGEVALMSTVKAKSTDYPGANQTMTFPIKTSHSEDARCGFSLDCARDVVYDLPAETTVTGIVKHEDVPLPSPALATVAITDIDENYVYLDVTFSCGADTTSMNLNGARHDCGEVGVVSKQIAHGQSELIELPVRNTDGALESFVTYNYKINSRPKQPTN